MVPKLGDEHNHKCARVHWAVIQPGTSSIRDEPESTPTAYVLCIHHVLDGNYTTPRYVDVRTERDGTEGLVS